MYSWKDRGSRLAAAVPVSNRAQFAGYWRTLCCLVLAACSLFAPAVRAVIIPIDLGAPGVRSADTMRAFDGLNGVSLNAQALSLDFVFANSQFARVFSVTPTWSILVTLQISGAGIVGFLSGTGFLLDDQQNAIDSARILGSANGPDSMSVGLFPLFPDDNGNPSDLQRPFDHFGVHLDLTLPFNPSVEITGGQFILSANGRYGVGPGHIPRDIVPESSATIVLFAIASCGLLAVRIWANPRRANASLAND